MCRNIKTLHNFAPPATEEEIRASSLQFVRKLSGFTKPSKANEDAYNRPVDRHFVFRGCLCPGQGIQNHERLTTVLSDFQRIRWPQQARLLRGLRFSAFWRH